MYFLVSKVPESENRMKNYYGLSSTSPGFLAHTTFTERILKAIFTKVKMIKFFVTTIKG